MKSSPIGVISHGGLVGVLSKTSSRLRSRLFFEWSEEGVAFAKEKRPVIFYGKDDKPENINNCSGFRFFAENKTAYATYFRKEKGLNILVVSSSSNLFEWKVVSEMEIADSSAAFVSDPNLSKKNLLFTLGLFAHLYQGETARSWQGPDGIALSSRAGFFDSGILSILGVNVTKNGILMIYDATIQKGNIIHVQAGGVLFDVNDPRKMIWRSEMPLWRAEVEAVKGESVNPLGVIFRKEETIIYWVSNSGEMIVAESPAFFSAVAPEKKPVRKLLTKHIENPILSPDSENEWESEAVFNPAAVAINDRVHILYRAMGKNGLSVLGYASSKNGINFDEKISDPVYIAKNIRNIPKSKQSYQPAVYPSGGGWGGCEDPRMVLIDGKVYVTFSAFDGWDFIRMAVISISEKDFLEKNFTAWSSPTFISTPGQIHKNWVIFPEKVKGQFAILHSITPKIEIEYRDDLEAIGEDEDYIKSWSGARDTRDGRVGFWDNRVRGAGPPPIKTKEGWLLFYHAIDMREPTKYKLGAMILDLDDPTKILYRTKSPLLVPDEAYENHGKPGIVYACGALVKDDVLYVYYGGADKVVCVATAQFEEFLSDIMKDVNMPLRFEKVNLS
ncbi:MAG: hypothetical protein WCI52_03910 [bacterium]